MSDDHERLLAVAAKWERLYREKCEENAQLRHDLEWLLEICAAAAGTGPTTETDDG